jgi:hypothetical protein
MASISLVAVESESDMRLIIHGEWIVPGAVHDFFDTGPHRITGCSGCRISASVRNQQSNRFEVGDHVSLGVGIRLPFKSHSELRELRSVSG